jgi:hypothetical protein
MTDKVKIEAMSKEIRNTVSSSKYLVVINGAIRKHNGNGVYVRVHEGEIVFFIKSRVVGMWVETETPELKDVVLEEVCSSVLYGRDFSLWTKEWAKNTGTYHFALSINVAAHILFIETDMYRLFKEIPKKTEAVASVKFTPTVNGKQLTTDDIVEMLGKFRVDAFKSMVELSRVKYIRAVKAKVRNIFRFEDIYFPGMIQTDNVFNPFFDDLAIYNQIKDRKLFRLFLDNIMPVKDTGVRASFLTGLQASEGLGLKEMVPFNFEILFNLLVGLVLDLRTVGYDFPNKEKRMMRLNVPTDEFERYITVEDWMAASDYQKGHYVASTTYNVFLLQNREFFRKKGFEDSNKLLEVMRNAILV